ncbi:MAG: polyhydroxyalkanoic acid system family protein [Pseudomonadota bacterium]
MSKPITITIPHDLGRAVARQRIEEGFGKISQQFGEAAAKALTKSWDGDRMDFAVAAMGQNVTGHLEVLDAAVHMTINLPNVLALIAGKIKGRVQKEGQLLLK